MATGNFSSTGNKREHSGGTIYAPGFNAPSSTYPYVAQTFDIAIPQGATINSATFDIYAGTFSTINFEIYFEASDNAAALSTTAYDISSRTAGTKYSRSDNTAEGTVHLECADALEELVGRAGWSSGNRGCFVIKYVSGGSFQDYSSRSATLVVDYTEGGGGGSSTPIHLIRTGMQPGMRIGL